MRGGVVLTVRKFSTEDKNDSNQIQGDEEAVEVAVEVEVDRADMGEIRLLERRGGDEMDTEEGEKAEDAVESNYSADSDLLEELQKRRLQLLNSGPFV